MQAYIFKLEKKTGIKTLLMFVAGADGSTKILDFSKGDQDSITLPRGRYIIVWSISGNPGSEMKVTVTSNGTQAIKPIDDTVPANGVDHNARVLPVP